MGVARVGWKRSSHAYACRLAAPASEHVYAAAVHATAEQAARMQLYLMHAAQRGKLGGVSGHSSGAAVEQQQHSTFISSLMFL
jgi:hypothetical protein